MSNIGCIPQMVADEQTQRLPFEREALTRFAKFCGYARVDGFVKDLTHHTMTRVERHYARLFEEAPELSVASLAILFSRASPTIRRRSPPCRRLASSVRKPLRETVRGWHFGRRAAVRQRARAREVLTELTPALLEAFAVGSGDGGRRAFRLRRSPGAHARQRRAPVDPALERIVARELFGDVLGSAPRLAQVIASRPHVLDAAIDPARSPDFDLSFGDEAMAERVETFVSQGQSFEEALNRARDFAAEETFHIRPQSLVGAPRPRPGEPRL